MAPKIKLEIHRDKVAGSKTHYHIKLIYNHDRFSIDFITPEQFTLPEANARVIRMAADLDAETDGFVIANFED